MKNVVWLSLRPETPARGYWDQHLLELAFKDYNHSLLITDQKEAIVIIPGAYQAYLIDEINYQLSQLYCSDCRYIKDKERDREYRRSILGCKPRKVISLKQI